MASKLCTLFQKAPQPHPEACGRYTPLSQRHYSLHCKAHRGFATIDLPTLEKGQVFHMDIGFVWGPANPTEVLAGAQDAEPKVMESRQGYVCYLLIIDNKTRYGWPFPLKSKSVAPTLTRMFLQTHDGNHTTKLPHPHGW
jgi:hypothetical protein